MKKDSVIKKEITINGVAVRVIKKNTTRKKMLEQGIITINDAEMDKRARTAVNMEKRKARVCKKPLAIYDKMEGKAYLVDSDGKKVTVD